MSFHSGFLPSFWTTVKKGFILHYGEFFLPWMEGRRTEDVAQCAYCKASYLYSEWKYNMIKTAQVSAGKKENSPGFESGCKHLNISQCRENTPSVKWEKLLVRPQDGFTAHLDQFSPCVADRFAKSLDHMILWIHLARVQAMHFWLNQSVVFNELLAATGGLDVECGLFYQNWQVYVIERRAKINTEGFLDGEHVFKHEFCCPTVPDWLKLALITNRVFIFTVPDLSVVPFQIVLGNKPSSMARLTNFQC